MRVRAPTDLPWPAGWARRTRGPQYRPAIALGVACVLLAVLLGAFNPADALLVMVFAAGLFIWAFSPAAEHPIKVTLREVAPGLRGVRFPLRRTFARRPGITLTPTAVVIDFGGRLVILWSLLTEVRATSAVTGAPHPLLPAPRVNWLTLAVADTALVHGASPDLAVQFGGNTVAGIPTTLLRSNALVLYHALHYYLDNPHARPELATEHAITRIHQARVEPHDA